MPQSVQRRVTIQPFEPGNAHRARMARGLVLTLAIFGLIVAIIAGEPIAYRAAAAILGWSNTGKLACLSDRLR